MIDFHSAHTVAERMDRLEAFLEFWLGPRKAEYGESTAALSRIALPEPLRRLYRFAGRWRPEGWGQRADSPPHVFCVQDELVELSKLENPADGRVMFLRENQNCWNAATSLCGDDGWVWRRETFEPGSDWEVLPAPLSKILVTFCLQELTFGAECVLLDDLEVEPIAEEVARATPLWVDAPYVDEAERSFYFLEPDLLVMNCNDLYTVSANAPRGVAFLRALKNGVRRIELRYGNGWLLSISPDGSARVVHVGGPATEARTGAGCFDFASLLEELRKVPGTAGPYYRVFQLRLPPGGGQWPVEPSERLNGLFRLAVSSAIEKDREFDALLREWSAV